MFSAIIVIFNNLWNFVILKNLFTLIFPFFLNFSHACKGAFHFVETSTSEDLQKILRIFSGSTLIFISKFIKKLIKFIMNVSAVIPLL